MIRGDDFNLYNFSMISETTLICVFNYGLKIDLSWDTNLTSCVYRFAWTPNETESLKLGRTRYSRISTGFDYSSDPLICWLSLLFIVSSFISETFYSVANLAIGTRTACSSFVIKQFWAILLLTTYLILSLSNNWSLMKNMFLWFWFYRIF